MMEQERETYIERTGYTPDLGEPTGDGLHGRYCVIAVWPGGGYKRLSQWATETMASRIAGIVADNGSGFAFVGVIDEHDPERGWISRKEKV